MEEDVAKINLLELKSLTNQDQIKELRQKELQLLKFSLKQDIAHLKKYITVFNSKKYFLHDSISQHKEINNLLHDEVAVVKDEFQQMVSELHTYIYLNIHTHACY